GAEPLADVGDGEQLTGAIASGSHLSHRLHDRLMQPLDMRTARTGSDAVHEAGDLRRKCARPLQCRLDANTVGNAVPVDDFRMQRIALLVHVGDEAAYATRKAKCIAGAAAI